MTTVTRQIEINASADEVWGMGTVFKAGHLGLEKTVAVKILPEQLTKEPKSIQRFMSEARSLAKIDHPNIVTVHHVGHEGGVHFIVMQLLEGGDLRDRLKAGTIAPKEAARIARDVTEGLRVKTYLKEKEIPVRL